MIFNTAANLIISVDSDGIIVECNDRIKDFLGYEKEEIIGQTMAKIIHPDYIAKVQRALNETLTHGVKYDHDYKMVRKNSVVIDVTISSAALKDEDGQFTRAICVITDKTYHAKEPALQETGQQGQENSQES